MTVRLISRTVPEDGVVEGMKTTEDIISYCARVSNPNNQDNFDTADKLIRYLIRKSHWSPFEMVDLTFEIATTRDIGRQILRHRSFSFQEFSQRYAAVDLDREFTYRELRIQDLENRQNSITVDINESEEYREFISWWRGIQYKLMGQVRKFYKAALDADVAKEQARALLPEGLTPTVMYMKGSMRSWFHYCLVRMHPGTQKEHREIAEAVWRVLQDKFEFCKTIDMKLLAVRYQEMFEVIMKDCIV